MVIRTEEATLKEAFEQALVHEEQRGESIRIRLLSLRKARRLERGIGHVLQAVARNLATTWPQLDHVLQTVGTIFDRK